MFSIWIVRFWIGLNFGLSCIGSFLSFGSFKLRLDQILDYLRKNNFSGHIGSIQFDFLKLSSCLGFRCSGLGWDERVLQVDSGFAISRLIRWKSSRSNCVQVCWVWSRSCNFQSFFNFGSFVLEWVRVLNCPISNYFLVLNRLISSKVRFYIVRI